MSKVCNRRLPAACRCLHKPAELIGFEAFLQRGRLFDEPLTQVSDVNPSRSHKAPRLAFQQKTVKIAGTRWQPFAVSAPAGIRGSQINAYLAPAKPIEGSERILKIFARAVYKPQPQRVSRAVAVNVQN